MDTDITILPRAVAAILPTATELEDTSKYTKVVRNETDDFFVVNTEYYAMNENNAVDCVGKYLRTGLSNSSTEPVFLFWQEIPGFFFGKKSLLTEFDPTDLGTKFNFYYKAQPESA